MRQLPLPGVRRSEGMKVDGRAGEYSAPRGHLTVGRRSSAAVGERERERECAG